MSELSVRTVKPKYYFEDKKQGLTITTKRSKSNII